MEKKELVDIDWVGGWVGGWVVYLGIHLVLLEFTQVLVEEIETSEGVVVSIEVNPGVGRMVVVGVEGCL